MFARGQVGLGFGGGLGFFGGGVGFFGVVVGCVEGCAGGAGLVEMCPALPGRFAGRNDPVAVILAEVLAGAVVFLEEPGCEVVEFCNKVLERPLISVMFESMDMSIAETDAGIDVSP
jgi:hypothetical protein